MKEIFLASIFSLFLVSCGNGEEDQPGPVPEAGMIVFETGVLDLNSDTVDSVCSVDTGDDRYFRVTFTPGGAAELERLTTENIGTEMSVRLGDRVLSEPVIREPISGQIPVVMSNAGEPDLQKSDFAKLYGVTEILNCAS